MIFFFFLVKNKTAQKKYQTLFTNSHNDRNEILRNTDSKRQIKIDSKYRINQTHRIFN